MKNALVYLLNLLEDEFRGFEEVRVRPVFPSGTRRSIDLVQDYDPESSAIHRLAGVSVQTKRKEFFFPAEWISKDHRSKLERQIQEIREVLGNR